MTKVLITGGSGFVGIALSTYLQDNGYEIIHLTRKLTKTNPFNQYEWNLQDQTINAKCIEGVDYIVHLAGAGIAEKKWTQKRKSLLLGSRVDSTHLLFELIKSSKHNVKAIVCASGIGYYGAMPSSREFVEEDLEGSDFVALLSKKWENATNKFRALGIKTTQLRIGLVLGKNGGALKELLKAPILSPIGNGKQIWSWIQINDLVKLIEYSFSDKNTNTVFNAIASNENNKQLTKKLAILSNRIYLPISIPEFLLNIALGKRAALLTRGNSISNNKIKDIGFKFEFTELEDALKVSL